MRRFLPAIFLLVCANFSFSQSLKTENVIMVVLDGMRWQEVFNGADSALVNNALFTKEKTRILKHFWNENPRKRREMLFPFMWKSVEQNGQIYGNRKFGNDVNVKNPFQMTYPGFSEMLTGYVDPLINSNRLVTSQSDNVLEFIGRQKGFQGKVAVFATSDLFPYLLNRQKSRLYINSDTDTLNASTKEFRLLNDMQKRTAKPTTERPDLLTYFAAREYLKVYKPRVLYLALGETDAYAHDGNYDQYLQTARAEDGMISELWNLVQSMSQYKNKTTLIITCDHGRGDLAKEQWTGHGPKITDSGQIWIAAIGPDTPIKGEITTSGKLFQGQLAATIAGILGLKYLPQNHDAMEAIYPILTK